MRVVIIGAGKLGYSIAEILSNEQYDVVVVDKDPVRLEAVKNSLDVLSICANGASPLTMNDADVRGADILIATTDSDEANLMACILAKKNRINHTVVRIRDMEFLSEAKEYLKRNFDIDLMLNPELIMALEIKRIIVMPAALNVEDFADGRIRLFETKIDNQSALSRLPLKGLNLPRDILAAMIFRDHHMIIPHGDDRLQAGDNAYFVGATKALEAFSESFVRRDAHKTSRVFIIGAGRTGRFLAPMLLAQGMKVKLVDKDKARCDLAAQKIERGLILNADGTDMEVMQEEGIGESDVVVCLTEDDKLNMMLAVMAKHLGARRTIVRVARSEYVDLMEKIGIDIALSARLLSASEVLAFVRRGGVVSVSLLEGAKAEAVEVIVPWGAPCCGRRLMDIQLPRECLVCAYVRGSEASVANGSTVLQPGDRVVLFIDKQHTKEVMKFFKGRE